MNIIIIGGGATLRGCDLSDVKCRGFVIGVNDSAIHARCHVALTMDRLWLEYRHAELKIPVYARRAATKNVTMRDRDFIFECDHKATVMSPGPLIFNGTNSGMCALNLAYTVADKGDRVYLLGFDMKRVDPKHPYWYPPYPWVNGNAGTTSVKRYSEWAPQFMIAAEQFKRNGVKVFNVTKPNGSDLPSVFTRTSFDSFRDAT